MNFPAWIIIALVSLLAADTRALHVSGRYIKTSSGQIVTLQGVSHSGTEFMCIGDRGIFDGPVDDAAIRPVLKWNINTVRIPLNEDCWLGINGVNPSFGGSSYQSAIAEYVDRLWSHGIYSILDLHWTAPGTAMAVGQQPMPNLDHSGVMWKSVALVMGDHPRSEYVIFDLFNEPYPDRFSNGNMTEAWVCWLYGGNCTGLNYTVIGMQDLVNTVRNQNASNMLMVGGLTWANNLTEWLAYKPQDILRNIVASVHLYNFNQCSDVSCWDSTLGPILAADVPVVIGEYGENDCAGWFVDELAAWFETNEVSRSAWTWNAWNCDSGPALISDYNGTQTAYGAAVYNVYHRGGKIQKWRKHVT